MKILQSLWLVSLLGCIVYLTTTAVVLSSAKFEGVVPEVQPLAADDDPSWRFRNPEFDQWVQDLQRERADLEARKAQLIELEARLQAERQELSAVTQRVAQLQMTFEKDVVRLRDQESKNLKKQAKSVADMAPDAAAALLAQMSNEDAAKLLSVMNNDLATALLEIMSKSGGAKTQKAAAIAERMRHVLPDPASTNSKPSPL